VTGRRARAQAEGCGRAGRAMRGAAAGRPARMQRSAAPQALGAHVATRGSRDTPHSLINNANHRPAGPGEGTTRPQADPGVA
jgi:hypothetical protein